MSKQQLTIEHLAPYLPYGLNIMHTEKNMMLIISGAYFEANTDNHFKYKLLNWESTVKSTEAKPLLRPLSDLTKEIEHNGEKFVPIKEIGDKYFGNLKRYECDGEISYGWDEQGFDDAQGYQFSFCEESIVFGVWYDAKEEGDVPIYSVGGYNDIVKLFEWHFDVFSLIEKGLAININDLKDE